MESKRFEFGVGIFVALGLAALVMLALHVSNLSAFTGSTGYKVVARFDNIGGLKVRSPVTMAGVRIGRVSQIAFDTETYEAVATLTIAPQYDRLPTDSNASIFTAGLLGEQYIGIEAGGEAEFLAEGDQIEITQSAVILEQLIGQFLYSQAADGPAK
ncbi:MAG: outer membrane lipid asymmetry maintenance protein MlaD [Gammaproteobacteria bacterium]|nr:outer membrane lipid asymmetry maintenance protein MlaD [Gammaproteobacteria bacterium]